MTLKPDRGAGQRGGGERETQGIDVQGTLTEGEGSVRLTSSLG
jgi:hypothetical protein